MIVYVPNDDVAPIISYLRRCTVTVTPTSEESHALARMEQQIDFEKKNIPYQMWLRNEEEIHADDNADRASGVGAARPARRDRVRQGGKSKPGKRGK